MIVVIPERTKVYKSLITANHEFTGGDERLVVKTHYAPVLYIRIPLLFQTSTIGSKVLRVIPALMHSPSPILSLADSKLSQTLALDLPEAGTASHQSAHQAPVEVDTRRAPDP